MNIFEELARVPFACPSCQEGTAQHTVIDTEEWSGTVILCRECFAAFECRITTANIEPQHLPGERDPDVVAHAMLMFQLVPIPDWDPDVAAEGS